MKKTGRYFVYIICSLSLLSREKERKEIDIYLLSLFSKHANLWAVERNETSSVGIGACGFLSCNNDLRHKKCYLNCGTEIS